MPRHFPLSHSLTLAATFLAVFTASKACASLLFANEPATHRAAGFAGNAVRIYVEEITRISSSSKCLFPAARFLLRRSLHKSSLQRYVLILAFAVCLPAATRAQLVVYCTGGTPGASPASTPLCLAPVPARLSLSPANLGCAAFSFFCGGHLQVAI